MKIRFLSNYDIAKNLLNIIEGADQYNSKKLVQTVQNRVVSSIPNLSKNSNNCDTFVKQSEKGIHK